ETFNGLATPPRATLRDADGTALHEIFVADAGEAERLGLRPPELVSFPSRDGVELYGGPHVQMVYDGWGNTVDLRAQYLARQGFLVFKVDNRGSARRGHAFEAAIFRRMGGVEVRDQVDGVRFLATLPEADTSRVGVYGWSYGGYMTLMCLLKAPDVYKA